MPTSTKNKEYRDRYSNKIRVIVRKAKNKPCVDCGKKYSWYVMDLDHVRGKKLIGVGQMTQHYGIETVKAEIKKCDVVCSNCHRIRTFRRRGIGL